MIKYPSNDAFELFLMKRSRCRSGIPLDSLTKLTEETRRLMGEMFYEGWRAGQEALYDEALAVIATKKDLEK